MKPAEFQYHRPRRLEEALGLLKELGQDAKILAGGQSLMPLMNFRLARPAHLIDINFIDGMDYLKSENGRIRVGCLSRQSRLLNEPLVRQRCPMLAEALAHVGHEQTRNRGTLCGSLAHADPSAELPAVLVALDGSVTVGNLTRRHEIAARDFFQSYLTTALSNDEMVLEASIPETPPHAGVSFMEFTRRFGDFAIVGVAALLAWEKGVISDARIALTGVGDKPWRERDLEERLIGRQGAADLFSDVGAEAAARINPDSDIHASGSYRRLLARVLTKRALAEAWSSARNGK